MFHTPVFFIHWRIYVNVEMKTRIMLFICILALFCPAGVLAATADGDNLDTYSLSTSDSSFVKITGINAVNYPNIITYVTVDTPEGMAGELTPDDFQIYENGKLMEVTSAQFPDKSVRTKLDLAILFDETGSMSNEITDLKAKVNELTDTIAAANIDCRYLLISFRDSVTVKQDWTSDPSIIKKAVDELLASGGDDAPEANLDAIETALEIGFRPDAQHMILDITDSTTHYRDDGTLFSNYTIPETAGHLLSSGISYILVGPATVSGGFTVHSDKKELVKALGGSGLFIDIYGDEFSIILDKIQSIITQTYTLGHYTPHVYGDDKKITLEVRVGSDADSGLFSVQKSGRSPAPVLSEDLAGFTDGIKQASDIDSISTFGRSVVDITGINGVNFPYILTYVTVNSTAGRTGSLTQNDFSIYEDDELMNITSFAFTERSTASNLDLAILFDDTGSMQDEIDDLKEKVLGLTESIASAGIDCRYALISFKDTAMVNQDWTNDASVIQHAVDGLNASEGFDAPEADLDAIQAALELGFRPDAQHMILDITDSTTHYRGDGTPFSNYTILDTAESLLRNGTSYILVGPTTVSGTFNENNDKRELVKALGGSGLFIDIHGNEFSSILDSIRGVITQTYTLGYYTPKENADGNKRPVLVVVGTDDDSGQYIATV